MSKPASGAKIQYCGHDAWFIGDIYEIGNVNVIHCEPIDLETINRPSTGATHVMMDFPKAGFWKPKLGVFVVPKAQVREIINKATTAK